MSLCSNCHTRISYGSKSGRCMRCAKLVKFSGRYCILCSAPIGKVNKSGICGKCRVKMRRSGKSEYVKKMEDVSSLIVKKKTGEWTTCHSNGCDEYFEVREGYNKVRKSDGTLMAWCDKCKGSPTYKNYRGYQNMTRTVKL